MNFEDIKKQAVSQWKSMQQSDKPRIFVGTGTCGNAAGADTVLEALRRELAENSLEADIIQVGCIGLCYAEPLIEVVKPGRPGVFYGNLTPELVTEIVRDYLLNDNPRPDLAMGTRGEGAIEGIPLFSELPVLKPQMRIALHRMGQLDAVQSIVDADKEASIIWEYATRIDRNSPLIAALSSGHYTQSEIDGMFAAAAQVTI